MKPILQTNEEYAWAKQRVSELTKESQDKLAEKLSTNDHKRRQHLGHEVRVLVKQIEELNEQIIDYDNT